MTLHFKYKRIDRPKLGPICTPSIPVTLKGEEKSLDVLALVDSGADVSLIPLGMAKHIGVKLEKLSDTKGIGGTVKAYESKISVIVGKGREVYRLTVPAKIPEQEDGDIPVILGREGFFTRFTITFDQLDRRILLKQKQTM